jgi:hypothetical protein
LNLWSPSIEIASQATPWVDVQLWARNHTPKDALFITPPQRFWLYESDWRVYSERSTVATYSELLVAAFNPEYTKIWTERFNAVAPGALPHFDGDYFTNAGLTKTAFYSLSAEALRQLACQYQVSYVVLEKPHTLPYPLLYENTEFSVFDLRHKDCK